MCFCIFPFSESPNICWFHTFDHDFSNIPVEINVKCSELAFTPLAARSDAVKGSQLSSSLETIFG